MRLGVWAVWFLCAVASGTAQAQFVFPSSITSQIYYGAFVHPDDKVTISMRGLSVTDTIYVYALGDHSVDPYVTIMDGSQRRIFAEDDDGGGYPAAALAFVAPIAGDYTVVVMTVASVGEYEIRVGINTPDLLDTLDIRMHGLSHAGQFNCDVAIQRKRPELSGEALTLAGDIWIIHYTLQGLDATTRRYISAMAEALQESLDVQFNQLGWNAPPSDCGEGGDTRLDIYVLDLSSYDALGLAAAENIVGDNPNTPARETFAAYSYLMIDNDMAPLIAGIPYDEQHAIRLMQVTVAHEIHHNIQFGYDINDPFFGFYEAGATWLETLIYPDNSAAAQQAGAVFSHPDVCIGTYAQDNELRVYGEWVLVDSLTQDLGREAYQLAWEGLVNRDGLAGFYESLDKLGTSPQLVIERMAVRNLLRDYALAEMFSQSINIEAYVNGIGMVSPRETGVQELAVDYVQVQALDSYRLRLDANAALTMRVVAIDMTTKTARLHHLGQVGAVDLTPYTHAFILILNARAHDDPENCTYADWVLHVSSGENAAYTVPSDEIWSAAKFVEPT